MPKNYWDYQRLKSDQRGSTLTIAAFSLIPLLAMLGGAVDMTRLYLVKNRLQQSCDAAVLGGRVAMGNKKWDDASKLAADRYFLSNYNPGRYGTSGSSIRYVVNDDSVVHGVASVSVPMALMQIFGFSPAGLQAVCDAKLELPNADIMFVLDTTLSMSEVNSGDLNSKLKSLQEAVKQFYNSIENSRGADTRVRYGFVPYSSTVNVGALLKPEWLVDRWMYQSREPNGTDQVAYTQSGSVRTFTDWSYVSGSRSQREYTIPPESCTAPTGNKNSNIVVSDIKTGSDGTKTWTETRTTNGIENSASLSNGICKIRELTYSQYVERQYVTEKPNPNAGQTTYSTRYWWKYLPIEYNVAAFKVSDGSGGTAGGSFTAIVANDHTSRTISWSKANACIEERQTTQAADALAAPAYSDLDVDALPIAGRPDTQWRPYLPGVIYARRQTSLTNMPATNWGEPTVAVRSEVNYSTPSDDPSRRSACPAPARKLASITASSLSAYLDTLRPAGLTYHDVGFLWGLRLLSAQGPFASENQAMTGTKLARHLIFMTDGQTETNIGDYDAYGLSALDRRRTPSGRLPTSDEQNTLIENRLSSLCRVAESKSITVWVIAFGTSLTPLLRNCSADGHAFEAKNTTELNEAFANIAGGIAQLRLVR
jgi:hypothetical protein